MRKRVCVFVCTYVPACISECVIKKVEDKNWASKMDILTMNLHPFKVDYLAHNVP